MKQLEPVPLQYLRHPSENDRSWMEIFHVPMALRRNYRKLRAAPWSPRMMEQGRMVAYFGARSDVERITMPIDVGGIGAGAIRCEDCLGSGTFAFPSGDGECTKCKGSGLTFISIP